MTLREDNLEAGIRVLLRKALAGKGIKVIHEAPTDALVRLVIEWEAPLAETTFEFEAGVLAGGRLKPEGIANIRAIADQAKLLCEVERPTEAQ